ncbi:hypothetical protein BDP27DRAFT_1423185 [Rhodocollybia butyracea]|uniref:Uncharacterized protein n=1 Tax=Rhodocollybia butyracea TaxID=206335 RepID=A0A9P5PPS1_9AGAR|nr:hypothetical protein BDP27DRAFT_1423185 [Rhodocollybia butyracea]
MYSLGPFPDPSRVASEAEFRRFLCTNFASLGGPQQLANTTLAISEILMPTPPAGSPRHRYLFLLFHQPVGQTLVNSTTSVEHWNPGSFAEATGLGQPVGGTFMLTELTA